MSHVDDGTLHAYLDGELSPAETVGVETHIAQCPACRERLAEARALIARADALLAIAAPPEGEVPPFRVGDVRPPARLWWRLRLPVAWAATVALALGIGAYLGGGLVSRGRPATAVATDTPTSRVVPAPVARDLAQPREPRANAYRIAPRPPAARVAAPAPAPQALDEEARRQDKPDQEVVAQADSIARERLPDGARLEAKMARLKAAEDMPYAWQKESPIAIDSARHLLGADPLVVPGLPIEAIYSGRAIGYSGLVLVEQVLDSGTMIEVINGRAAPAALAEVVTTNQARAADSLAPAARKRALPPPAAAPVPAVDRAAPARFVDIRGPLSADSLAALRRLLQPLRP